MLSCFQRMEEEDGMLLQADDTDSNCEYTLFSDMIKYVRFITVFIYILIDNTTQTHHSQSKTFSLLLASAIVNGNTSCSTANSKASPESTWSWSEDRCNGHAPGRFSSPASGLSGFSSSVMSATSESALSTQSGYSSGRDGKNTDILHIYTLFTVYT